MQERTRQRVLLFSGLVVALLLGAWWYSGFSLEFMRFFAAEPGPTGGQPTVSVLPAGCYYQEVQCVTAPCDPVMVCPSPGQAQVECDPSTQSVKVGTAATLTATGGDGGYDWFSPGGNPTSSGAQSVSYQVVYDTTGTKIVTVQAGRAGNSAIEDTIACTVTVNP